MKRALLAILIGIALALPTLAAADLCRDSGYRGYTLRQCRAFCERLECDATTTLFTNRRCVQKFDRFFAGSDGQMIPCIPTYEEMQEYHANEILCYSNWQYYTVKDCDPQFDPNVDEYEVIDEADGISPYEICLMNKRAQFEVCLLSMELQAIQVCYLDYQLPCYEEFNQTGDQETLDACLLAVEDEVAACQEEIRESFYFTADFSE